MSATERDSSRDRDSWHQHSFSESGRSSVPMWDSSDPDRAPPPLPLNPGSSSPTTKANTSAGIAAAAKAIVERARESAPLSSYTSNQPMSASPERSLIKGAHHKRMQSLQPGNVKDLRSYLDGNRSPERSPERPTSSIGLASFVRKQSTEDIFSLDRSSTPTPVARDLMKDTPTLRPSTRQPPRAILGENTPPSATMLALQTMQVPDQPFNDITNGPNTPTSTPRVSTTYDFSSQLLNLTAIATSLQKEMAGLSRRSKDNATDLISLKEATSQRDEDIRKSLRELANHVTSTPGLLGPLPPPPNARSMSAYASHFLDNKAFSSPPSATKSYSVPRASSVHSFMDEGRVGSPSPYSVEGAASVAMLEKIIREMVTKEGQERLLSTLSELLDKSSKDNVDAAKKVEELAEFIKEKSQSQALVPAMLKDDKFSNFEPNFEPSGCFAKTKRETDGQDESHDQRHKMIMDLLSRVRDSVLHSGGTTAEVKGLVRDLRGEVLGMGRELGRKLDQVGEAQLNTTLDRSIQDGETKLHADEVQRIVDEGLAELKEHFSQILAHRAEQDDDTFKQLAIAQSGPNGNDIFAAVKDALAEHGNNLVKLERTNDEESSRLDKEGVLEAVKDGLRDFEPNIELQQFGLERDEILAVLKEGLEDYQRNRAEPATTSIDKGEIYEAIHEALKDFQTPFPNEAMVQMRDEVLATVRLALEGHRAADVRSNVDDEATRTTVLESVKEALANHGPNAPREFEISRDDLFDAVKASMDGSTIPFGSFGEQVLQQMHELIDGMRVEFKQYSAANGRDTEQVLDAVKDGLESLRAEIESYVDRAQDVTGKDEIVDTVRGGLEQLRVDIRGYCAQGPEHDGGKAEMLDYIKGEFEHLHETIGSRDDSREPHESISSHTAEIILALKEGMDGLKSHVSQRSRSLDGEEPDEEVLEAMKEEFGQLKMAILNANAADKDELIETIQGSMGALHSNFGGGSELNHPPGGVSEEIIQEMHAEFNTLKETLHSIIGEADRDAIVSGVRQSMDDLRVQLSADQNDASIEALGAIKEELENFREAMATSVVLGSASNGDSRETLNIIRAGLEEVKETTAKSFGHGAVPTELLEAMRGEFENIRTSIATGVVHRGSNEELLDEVRLGLDDLRGHIEKKLDNPERHASHYSEVLDALNDGLENLKTEVVKTLDKPLDMTVNYEILDTLKDGLAGLRADLDTLRHSRTQVVAPGGEIVLADGADPGESRGIALDAEAPSTAEDGVKGADMEGVEVLLAQLQIKIEAMDATVQDLPAMQPAPAAEGTAMKNDLVGLEALIREVQVGVTALAVKESAAAPEGAARKEDTDAIETLLRNTKAQIDEIVRPDPSTIVTREQFDAMEAMIRATSEAVDDLSYKAENTTAAKADVAVVEVLAQDVKTALEELKERMPIPLSDEEKPELMTKADLDVLGVLCTEIKTTVNEMVLPDPEELPTKAEIEQLQGLIVDFRESHDKLRDSYETDIAVTAKAFDDRKKEFEDTVEQISLVKETLAEVKDELIAKMSEGESVITTLGETMKSLEEKAGGHEPVITEVKEVLAALEREFDRTHGSLDAMKIDHQSSSGLQFEKQVEVKEAVISQLGEKLDVLFDGLMIKYDDAQHAAEKKAKATEENSIHQEELLNSTKAMADDLKLSIDTLGTALTSFTATYPEHMDKMAEESSSVFKRVDDTWNKLDETQEGLKYEHGVTREEVARVAATVGAVQNDLMEHNPRFMVTLQELHALIGKHYEQAQQSTAAAAEHHQAVRDLSDQLRIGFDDTRNLHEAQTRELKTALPVLLPPPVESGPAVEQYNDTALHEKLDQLMDHSKDAAQSSVQLERLDQIHEKVMATAAEVSAFVSAQARQITEDHVNKEKEAEEVALLLERRLVQKEEMEADIAVLAEERESLQRTVEAVKAEREEYAAQKSRLSAEVSSLETALRIRRDELHEMDCKAEAIERRILEGVMNQSRMLLLAKTAKAPQPKKPQGRDLRIPSNASAQTVTSSVPALKTNHALAMRSRPPMARHGAQPNTAERRIMSLSQINHNVPTGNIAFSTATPSLISTGPQALKRSHSVKTQPLRKPSWAAKRNASLSSHNKENETLSEEDEDDFRQSESRDGDLEDFTSDTATERRTSYISGRESDLTYDDGSYAGDPADDGGRASYGTSDLSYGTGSYMTGSEIDRRTSWGSSANGILGAQSQEPIQEEDESEAPLGAPDPQHAPLRIETARIGPPPAQTQVKHFFAPPSDSGLGTDLPTAALSGSEYFRSDRD